MTVRDASGDDLDALAALVARANATYRDWAGQDWRRPGVDHERWRWRSLLDDPRAWSGVAIRIDRIVGCVGFTAARAGDESGEPIPGLAHLSRLFVEPNHWRQGIGGQLLAVATDRMHRLGYRDAQLFTPAANERTRRFYERHGWRPTGDTRAWRGLTLIRYTRPIQQAP